MWIVVLIFLRVCVALKEPPCPPALSVTLEQASLLQNHSLISGGRIFPPDTFWQTEDGVYIGCPCQITTCIRTCSSDKIEGLQLPVWRGNESSIVDVSKHFAVISGETCMESVVLDEFKILRNGSLLHEDAIFKMQEFCILLKDQTPRVSLCSWTMEMSKPWQYYVLNHVLQIFSVICLGFTILAYYLAGEMRTLHGRSLTAYCVSLCCAFISIITIQVIDPYINYKFCYFPAFTTYVFLMASYLWLNVLCLDIWWSFRTLTGARNHAKMKTFLLYCVYACCTPLILYLVILAIDLSTSDGDLRPGIGISKCWFQNILSSFIYFDLPICLLFAVNLFCFVATAKKIVLKKKELEVLGRTHNNNKDRQRFRLYLKLFLVMGVVWMITEVIWWLEVLHRDSEELWYITDICYNLQGVFIFVILCVCKSKIRTTLLRALLPKKLGQKIVVTSETSK